MGSKDIVVKADGKDGLLTVAGLRSRRVSLNGETVNVVDAEPAGRWKALAKSAGIKRAHISGRGLFKDAASDAMMRQSFFDGAVKPYQINIADFGTIYGPFQISSLEFAGEHNGEITYDVSFESAGELTFADAQ